MILFFGNRLALDSGPSHWISSQNRRSELTPPEVSTLFLRDYQASGEKGPNFNPVPRNRATEKRGHLGPRALRNVLSVVPLQARNPAELRGFADQLLNFRGNPRLGGGEGGIRTLGTRESTTVFETAPFDHSGTSPRPDRASASPRERGRQS